MTLDGENELARHPLPGDRTLVWRDDGSPYDNTLQVYVLAADGSTIDALEAGAAFTTSLLAFRREGPEVFDFSFSRTTGSIASRSTGNHPCAYRSVCRWVSATSRYLDVMSSR